MPTVNETSIGGWIVHHAKKLDSRVVVPEFKAIRRAGKAGVLLSAITSDEKSTLTTERVEALATAAGIDTSMELPQLLLDLQSSSLVETTEDGINVLGLTTSSVLTHTANLFDRQRPTSLQRASIDLAEICSVAPRTRRYLSEILGDTWKLSSPQVSLLIDKSAEYGLTDFEGHGTSSIYFNGNLFRADSKSKILHVVNSLTTSETNKVNELNQTLSSKGCVTQAEAEKVLSRGLFLKLQSIGMYDINAVSNSQESESYVTRPAAFSKYSAQQHADAFDFAKAFVASLTYGMTRSAGSRGRISMFSALMNRLIQGNWVGPATAIGQDYKILELRNVIQLRPANSGMYYMRLLKREVGEIAYSVLTSGDGSASSADLLPGASITNYTSPEQLRVATRTRRTDLGASDVRGILDVLRQGGDR